MLLCRRNNGIGGKIVSHTHRFAEHASRLRPLVDPRQILSCRFLDATVPAGLQGMKGWWSSLTTADVNGDGRLDIIAGNLGVADKR